MRVQPAMEVEERPDAASSPGSPCSRFASPPTPVGPSESAHDQSLSPCDAPRAVHHPQSPRYLAAGPRTGRPAMTRPPLEVADVVRQYGADYLARYGAVTSTAQRRVLQAVAQCRTAVLGGHKAQCGPPGAAGRKFTVSCNRGFLKELEEQNPAEKMVEMVVHALPPWRITQVPFYRTLCFFIRYRICCSLGARGDPFLP